MNNDMKATSSSAASLLTNSATTTNTVPCNGKAKNAGREDAIGGSINVSETSPIPSVATMATNSNSKNTNSLLSPALNPVGDAVTPNLSSSKVENENEPNKTESWEDSREQLKDWDYCSFKQLLDEAYSYKNPRDKENKSAIFKQMLDKVEKEKEDQKFAFRALASRSYTSNSQKQGGSLQDLVEAVRNDSLDCDYNYGGQRNRRHNHNSRPKKYSSVSSRQREGGSLPSNVNVSNFSLSAYEQPFLNEQHAKHVNDKKESRALINTTSSNVSQRSIAALSSKNTISTPGITKSGNGSVAEITISTKPCTISSKSDIAPGGIGCGGVCEAPRGVKGIKNAISLAATIGSATSATCAALATATAVVSGSTDTVVEMNDNYIDPHSDMLSQGIQFDRFDGIEMKIPRANIIGSVLSRSDFPTNNNTCYVDEAVHFTTLERGKSTVDPSYIPLDENYKACKSVLGEKSELVKMQSLSASKTISKQYDENGNSLNTTFTVNPSQPKIKKKKTHSERNTKTLDVQSVEGYRGSDPIEELVKYIESSEDTKQNEKVNKFSESKKKDKKRDKEKDKDKDKERGKIKRSNSLEELRTCSKIDADDVTMRNKTNVKNSKNADMKEKLPVSSVIDGGGYTGTNRKIERRSWGTEELTYLGENNAIEEVRERIKEKEKKKSKENNLNDRIEKVAEKRKKNDSNIIVSMESISCESAEFHVVTKKKKPKKQRQLSTGEPRNNSSSSNAHKNQTYQNRKYQSNFCNDREAYMGSFNNNSNEKSRRKSTSSMPPSEKSDSSDLDSVHSLPIEPAGGRCPLQVHNHHQNQPRSYAEIARKTDDAASAAAVSSATVIDSTASKSSSNNSSYTELEVNSAVAANTAPVVNIATKKSKKTIKTDFPELISSEITAPTTAGSMSTNNNAITTHKQISYSQSLTSTTGKNEDHPSSEIALQTSPAAETIKSNEKHIQKHPHSQMPLQKSKSVETESYYNSIDQYPALEKTVKRHSTINTCPFDVAIVVPTTFQSPRTDSLETNSILSCVSIDSSTTTTSSNKKSKTNANTKTNDEVIVEQQHLTMAKKSKREKQESYSFAISPSSATPTSSSIPPPTSSSNIINKNKSSHNHDKYNNNFSINTNDHKSSYSSSNNNNSSKNSNNNKFSNRPAVIILNDDSSAGSCLSSCIVKEFTFGDFNEDELRLFEETQPSSQHSTDVLHTSRISKSRVTGASLTRNADDSGSHFNTTGDSNASDQTNNSDDALILMQHTSSPNSSLGIDQSSDSGICNNYKAAIKSKRTNQQNTAKIETRSIDNNRSLSTDTLINNSAYLSASTSPSKESLSSSASSSSSTSSNSSASSGTYVLNAPSNKAITLSTSKSSKSKTAPLAYMNYNQKKQPMIDRSKPNKISPNNNNNKVSTLNKRHPVRQQEQNNSDDNPKALPSLETCDDIETAIIAAAKKAAAVAAEQTCTSVINKNYTTKVNSNKINTNLSTMGSTSASTSICKKPNNNNINKPVSSFNQKGVISTSLPLSSISNQPNVRGGNSCISVSDDSTTSLAVKEQQRKVIDVHFVQPNLPPINSLQNNEIIINFIGSAWEEVANSKVTQFYDGQ